MKVYPSSPLGEKTNLPTGRDVEWEPLVDFRRNGVRIPFTARFLGTVVIRRSMRGEEMSFAMVGR